MKNKKIEVNDGVLNIFDNEKDSQAIIFLHGLTGNYLQLQYYVEYFSNKYRVITLDLRNRGESISTLKNSNLNVHANDVVTIINELKLEKPIIVGYSMGAFIGAIVSSQIELKSLILLDGAATMSQHQDDIVKPTFGRLSNIYESKEVYVDNVVNNYKNMGIADSDKLRKAVSYEIKENSFGWQNKAVENAIRSDWDSFYDFDIKSIGSKIVVPTLLVKAKGKIGQNPPLFLEENYINTENVINKLTVENTTASHYTLVFEERLDVIKFIDDFLKIN